MTITVVGAPEAIRKLNALQGAGLRRAVGVALRASALIVQNDAKRRAPVKTGNLRRSIHTEYNDATMTAKVGTDVVYARRIEYGFVGADSLGRVFDQRAQPYLRPAVDENIGRIRKEFEGALQDALRMVA